MPDPIYVAEEEADMTALVVKAAEVGDVEYFGALGVSL